MNNNWNVNPILVVVLVTSWTFAGYQQGRNVEFYSQQEIIHQQHVDAESCHIHVRYNGQSHHLTCSDWVMLQVNGIQRDCIDAGITQKEAKILHCTMWKE